MPLLLVSALLLLLGLPGAAVAAAPRPDRAHGGASVGNATERRLACIQRAEVEIARAPDKDAWRVTTTHAFKRDVAHFFCAREPEKQVVLELGIFKGHSTAVLASIFAKVISVDVSPEYTHDAARHSPNRKNIVFMALDTYLTDWSFLSANRVDVAVIDADHKYEKVRADAVNVLHTFPDVQWLVFDDYATEPADVKRAVDELIEEQVLVRCRPIGRGKDGRPWEMKGYKAYVIPEGMICARGPGSANKKAPFLDVTYLVYPVPGDPLVGRPSSCRPKEQSRRNGLGCGPTRSGSSSRSKTSDLRASKVDQVHRRNLACTIRTCKVGRYLGPLCPLV
mmetsp:Transcript_162842/g.517364  ORF Transcript_162842/g.517364 Transcript_162842/m.517364 type:complete len:337 (-) Transcript_162842:243-1253(-)